MILHMRMSNDINAAIKNMINTAINNAGLSKQKNNHLPPAKMSSTWLQQTSTWKNNHCIIFSYTGSTFSMPMHTNYGALNIQPIETLANPFLLPPHNWKNELTRLACTPRGRFHGTNNLCIEFLTRTGLGFKNANAYKPWRLCAFKVENLG